MIQVNGLTKYYGNRPAAKDISFKVEAGEVFGLLGTNGAGKSTTIKMMCGLLKPTRGAVRIGGVDLKKTPLKAKSMMGYLPENPQMARPVVSLFRISPTGKSSLTLKSVSDFT